MNLRDRALVGILSVALIALSVAALAPTLQSSNAEAEPTSPIIPEAGGRYVEGVLGRATNASPFGARSGPDRSLVALLFRGLVRLGPGSAITGDLAQRWEVTDSGRTWTFHLRPNLFWQDGAPLTADDVAFTVGVLSDPAYTGPGGESWRDVTATVADDQTVVLHLTTPLGGFLQAATQPIAPSHLLDGIPLEALPDDPFGQQPVGSGPFRLVYLNSARALLAAATPIEPLPDDPEGPNFNTPRPTDSLASARPTAKPLTAVPYLASIEIRYYDDLDALQKDWASGALNAASGLRPADATALAARPGARLVRYPGTTMLAVALNLRGTSVFGDPAVRKALLQAIDRDTIVKTVLAGLGSRADSLIPPSSPMFDASASPEVGYDPAAAKKGLTAAGWKSTDTGWTPKDAKEPLVIEVLCPEELANPVAYAVAQDVVEAWHGIGLAARLIPLPASELLGDRLARADYQVAVLPFAIGLDPDVYPLLAASQTRTGGSNVIGLQDPDLDKLLVAARSPIDDTERATAYKALEQRLSDRTYMLPLAFRDEYVVLRDSVVGPASRPVGTAGDRYWDVLIWRLADGS
ncbi:MAG TPA: peptide ABC transporter substrate-binding protein [Candidatus Limnocylindrales bacterium]|nr:peptide ABC transporter substrate-binding protein [Candidatus Limnocylindrales bacterium]